MLVFTYACMAKLARVQKMRCVRDVPCQPVYIVKRVRFHVLQYLICPERQNWGKGWSKLGHQSPAIRHDFETIVARANDLK